MLRIRNLPDGVSLRVRFQAIRHALSGVQGPVDRCRRMMPAARATRIPWTRSDLLHRNVFRRGYATSRGLISRRKHSSVRAP
jgi:hypothetical protein